MREHDKKSHEIWLPWVDRIIVAWAIQIAVVVWIAFGAVGQCNRLDQARVECRTTSGDIGFKVPIWR
jgi:hypothetical protein